MRLGRERVEPGESVELSATVMDSAYIGLNDARVTALVTHPSGAVTEQSLAWSVEEDGEYGGSFLPREPGTHGVVVRAERAGGLIGEASTILQVGPSQEEYFDAGRRTPLLRRLAEDTGGRFYTPASVSNLPEDLRFTGAGVTLTEERDLWDMPIVLILILGLLGAEWGYRRLRGMV